MTAARQGWLPLSSVAVLRDGTNPDRLATESGNAYVSRTPEAFTYDADGNLTQDGRWNYTWDGENRLVKVESRTTTPLASRRKVEWQYDALGRRIGQTTSDRSSGTWQVTEDLKFVSDPVLFGRHLAELNATNNALVRSYVWGLDLSGSLDGAGGVGGLLFVTQHSTPQPSTHFVCYDGNGNVAALVNATDGTETARYEYGPFGETLRLTSPMAKESPFRFSTKRMDNTTDLVLYEFRAYDPDAGRFLTQDPIGEIGGLNLYACVENNPVAAFDPAGLCARPCDARLPLALPNLRNPLPDIHGRLCNWLEGTIRGFLKSPEEIRAWNRFVDGSANDIELSDREMGSVLGLASKFQAELKQQAERCKTTPFYWINQETNVEDMIGRPWTLAIGGVTIKLKTSCTCRTLTWEACIFDRYDFDPKWWHTHRPWDKEVYVILVRAAQVASQCGWKEFHHKGCKDGFIAN